MRTNKKNKFTLAKTPYENCKVRHLDGEIIFYCNYRRAKWYLDRKLATVVSNDPLEIQLTFKTKGFGNRGDKFYLQHRKNICVVCGTDQQLTRHHVVPYCFRRFLPEEIKDHNYHDILLLCATCHETYEQYAYELKSKLADEYNAPIDGIFDRTVYKDNIHIKGYAHALVHYGDKIPSERKDVMLNYIKEKLRTDEPNLQELASKSYSFDVVAQGKIIVSKLTNIESFLRRWREHFIETMKPKYLPNFWSVSRGLR